MNNKVNFDDYSENYNQLLKEETGFFSDNEAYFAQYKVELVRQKITTPVSNILEYGCGIGRNIPFLQLAFPDATIVGSDISNASLDIARRNHQGVEFFQEHEQTHLTNTFDLIFVAGVFHHIPIAQRLTVANTLLHRLSPQGQLFVFEHNPYNPVTRRIVSNCPYDEDAVLLKPKELKQLLITAGFSVKQQGYCLFIPPKFSTLTCLENYLSWLPLGGQYWLQAEHSV